MRLGKLTPTTASMAYGCLGIARYMKAVTEFNVSD